jgi:uncharacterized protein
MMVAIIAKVTDACNSNCAYCDVVNKSDRKTTTMTADVLERMYVIIGEYLENPRRSCEVVWHGGEPLLAGTSFFEAAAHFRRKYCAAAGTRLSHSIQTNLTKLKPEFLSAFRDLGITSVGTSYDPNVAIRGPGLERRSDVYNKEFMRGVRVLDTADIPWGAIYVVTSRNLDKPLSIFNFMTNLNPDGNVMFNPVLMYGEDPMGLAITPEQYVDFLGAIFPTWWQYRERYRGCQPFQAFTDAIVHRAPSLSCGDAGRCHDTHMNIASDGSVSQCGRAADWGVLNYGSIFNQSIEQILGHSERTALRERNSLLLAGDCRHCHYWNFCHGGCPLDAWADAGLFARKTPWCFFKHGFIEKYFEPVTGVRYEPPSVSSEKK